MHTDNRIHAHKAPVGSAVRKSNVAASHPQLRITHYALRIIIIATAMIVCWLIDITPVALPLEAALAERAACALRAVLCGLGLDDTLHCVVAPACSGLRTAVALALFCAWTTPSALKGICVGIPCGLGLNLWRILMIELALRFNPALGDFCHTFALQVLILPTFFVVSRSWSKLGRTPRLLLGALAAELFVLLFILLPQSDTPYPEIKGTPDTITHLPVIVTIDEEQGYTITIHEDLNPFDCIGDIQYE